MPTIDLGVVAAGSGPGAVGPDRAAPRWSGRRRRVRQGLLAAVLAGVLGTVAAGDPVPRPWPEVTVPAWLGSIVHAERDWLFVVDPGRSGRGGPDLAAYRMPEAKPGWRVTLPSGDVGSLQLVGEHLLLARYPRPLLGRPSQLTVLDLSTGAVAWEREASVMVVGSGGDLVLWVGAEEWRPGAESRPGMLEAVDPASGAVRWSLPVPAGALPSFDVSATDPAAPGRASTLVLALPSGRVEVRDLGTGAVLRAADLPPSGTGPRPTWRAAVAAGMLLVYEASTVTAYGLPGLDRRWSVPMQPAVERGPFVCGADLCSLFFQRGVRVWDAQTGRTRWSDERWSTIWTVGDALVAALAPAGGPEVFSVLDPATGRVLADLGSWDLLTPYGSRFLGVRYGADRRAWVAEFDPVTWRHRLLTVLPGVSGDCGLTATALHCRRMDASIAVWRLPG